MIADKDNIRVDQYLAGSLDISRSKVQKLIKEGKVLVDGEEISCNYIVKTGDNIEVLSDLDYDIDIEPEDIKLDIVYEDQYLLIVNKKSGMVVHPGNGNYSKTLVNALIGYTEDLSDEGGLDRVGIVHRIDKDTSGILLIAKTNEAHRILSDDFKNKRIKRKYLALVHGVIDNNKGKIVAPIGRSKVDRKKMCVTDENSKNAITNFTVLERYKNATLIECILETGRTHQIRVHMEYINHPIVNDPLYGKRKLINDYGQMLHAEYLGFNHPITGKFMEFYKDPEKEFNDILEMFKNS